MQPPGKTLGPTGDEECQRQPNHDDERGQEGQQQVFLAAEHSGCEAKTEKYDRQAVDGGVEEHERELALAHTVQGHPEAVEHPSPHTHAAERAAGHEHATPKLRPGDASAEMLAATPLPEQVFGIQDAAP